MIPQEFVAAFLIFSFCSDWSTGNPRVTPEVTRDVCLLARMMAANLYYSQIEDLMFEVFTPSVIWKILQIFPTWLIYNVFHLVDYCRLFKGLYS